MVTCEGSRYYVVTDVDPRSGAETRYELTGKDVKRYVGDKIEVTGDLKCGAAGVGGVLGVLAVSSASIIGGAGLGASALLIGGVAVAAGTGLGVGLYEANKSASPASR
jgi:hypothetical protein